MKAFSELGITTTATPFSGPKIKMKAILNLPVTIIGFKIRDSRHGEQGDKCLHLSLSVNNVLHVLFTGSKPLLEQIKQVAQTDFPFTTTIKEENDSYQFT